MSQPIMPKQSLAVRIAGLLLAMQHCERTGQNTWRANHSDALAALCREEMPSGSGFDAGTQLVTDASTPDKLVFTTSFHHMTEQGFYDGWTEHTVTVTPSFISGWAIRISGRNRNDIKELIMQTFDASLSREG